MGEGKGGKVKGARVGGKIGRKVGCFHLGRLQGENAHTPHAVLPLQEREREGPLSRQRSRLSHRTGVGNAELGEQWLSQGEKGGSLKRGLAKGGCHRGGWEGTVVS